MEKTQKAPGLSVEQLNDQLDQFEGQMTQLEQQKILLEFDVKNYEVTLQRKIRDNARKMKVISSNINVIKNDIKKAVVEEEPAKEEAVSEEKTE